ncbi:hypothetical protein NQ317_015269 [Molorchus minor]|uniref:Uncharacterized protein n=1 Tax=Molorchus minor TaxID=1323400 RepID=A0ABQ9JAC8_9CUCU|nr:hypothetical protein NQ317_015269 [Molorchus minor]
MERSGFKKEAKTDGWGNNRHGSRTAGIKALSEDIFTHTYVHEERGDYTLNQFKFGATEIDILPLEDSFQSCVEGGYTYIRHRTHNHSLNRCQLFRRESNPPDEAS